MMYTRPTYSRPVYVVTFNRAHVDGLRRMTLPEARQLVKEAARIPKHGRIVNVITLEEVTS